MNLRSIFSMGAVFLLIWGCLPSGGKNSRKNAPDLSPSGNQPVTADGTVLGDILSPEVKELGLTVTTVSDDERLKLLTNIMLGRDPFEYEYTQLKGKEKSIPDFVDEYMKDPFFYVFFREWFEPFSKAEGIARNSINILALTGYPPRKWWEARDAQGKIIGRVTRNFANTQCVFFGLKQAPRYLASYILQTNRPFTEILTADYTMVNPCLARSYGVLPLVRFARANNAFEFKPVKLPAISIERGNKNVPSTYQKFNVPGNRHAGILTMDGFLQRWPHSEGNAHRNRAYHVLKYFYDTDLFAMDIPPRPEPPAAENTNPVQTDPNCSVCHNTLDPVANSFVNYPVYRLAIDGMYKRTNPVATMLDPGLDGVTMPIANRGKSLQWLAQEIVKSDKFARSIVKQLWSRYFGLPLMEKPSPKSVPGYQKRYDEHIETIEGFARFFRNTGHDMRKLIKAIAISDIFAAKIEGVTKDTPRHLIKGYGRKKFLSPTQIQEKIFRKFNVRLNLTRLNLLLGGTDSVSVTDSIENPNSIYSNALLSFSHDLVCRSLPTELIKPANDRLYLRNFDVNLRKVAVSGNANEVGSTFDEHFVEVYKFVLQQEPSAEAKTAMRKIFMDAVADALAMDRSSNPEGTLPLACQRTKYATGVSLPADQQIATDPKGVIRGLGAVLFYIITQPELYILL